MTPTRRRGRNFLLAGFFAAVVTAPGHADLGGLTGSVQADQLHLHAAMQRTSLAAYVRHELVMANGATVHEYTNAQGQVFAIRWAGPGQPNLRRLLGASFAPFQAANIARAGRFGALVRQPVLVDQPDLKVQAGGHMGYFRGLAWLPALLPPGTRPGDLR